MEGQSKRRGRPRLEKPALGASARIAKPALHVQAVDRLRDMIVRGVLAPGSRVAEAAICDALGVSRTPLREALKLLAAEGLVALRPNRGAIVTPLSVAESRELFEAMSGIERVAAELAAVRLTTTELNRLHALQDRMEAHFAAGRRDEYFRINQDIHQAILAGAKNNVLLQTHTLLLARAERARYFALQTPERWAQSVEEHRAILKALESRDASLAGTLLGEHVGHTGDAVAATLAKSATEAA